MFSSASLHPVAYFAILAATFSYLYAQHRQLHFLLWGLGWAVLAVRQVLVAALGSDAPWFSLDIAAGILVLLGGMAFSGRSRFGISRAAVFGLTLGVLAALVLTALAVLAPQVGPYRAASLSILVATWVGAGWLVDRYGRAFSPTGARIAGLALMAWGFWLPVEMVLGIRFGPATWPSEIEAVLGALVAVGMILLAIEESRARAESADPRAFLADDPNMISVIQDRRIVYANPAFLDRLGWSLAELRQLDTLEFVAPEYRDEAARRRQMRERGEAIPDYEIELVDARGGRLAVIVHADPIQWDGRPAHKYELIDLTPRRRAEAEIRRINAELRRMNQELEQANRLQTEFLSNTTHELKTPLTSIMANTEILEYEMCGPVNAEQRRVLANISRNSQHLLEMISRLLDFARQRAGAAALRVEEVHAREILEGVAETVRPLLEEKGVELAIEVGPELDACWLDGEKIYRVYLNLVENAVKFSSGGTVRMSARISDGELEGSVTDQGIGIPPDRLEDIFHAFTQVDASSTRPYPGVGLGLAICKQLVELHGGRIWAESNVGQGSSFRFRVPCTPGVLPVEDAAARHEKSPTS
jgi:PAS domain S-box-containing protein